MKLFVSLLLFVGCLNASSQIKNTLIYDAEIIRDAFYKREDILSKKPLVDKVLGIDVKIYVDTIFKKYSIIFTDKDQQRKLMVFNYVRDYFPNDKSQFPELNKLYLMEMQGELYFMSDYMDSPIINALIITSEKTHNGYLEDFTIKDPKKKAVTNADPNSDPTKGN